MKFCNLNINLTNKEELFLIDSNKPKCIVTLNAQIITLANTNKRLFEFINENYATIDGEVPLKMARLTNKKFKKIEKLSGSEIIYDFCRLCKEKNMKLFFLGGKEESNKEAVKKVKEKYEIDVSGYSPSYEEYPFSSSFVNSCLDEIKKFKPDIIFIGFGSPKQEYFMQDNINEFKNLGVKFCVGSGGTVDFVSGYISRCPKFLSKLGLEGFYRLFKEFNKSRFKRITYSFKFFKFIWRGPRFK